MESNSGDGKDNGNPGPRSAPSAAAGDRGDGRAEAAGKDRNGKRLAIIAAIVIPLLVALISAATNIYDTYISKKTLASVSTGQQKSSPGRIDASAFSSAPASPFPTADIPASTSKPSLDAHNPPVQYSGYVQCQYVRMYPGQGFSLSGGCPLKGGKITGTDDLIDHGGVISPGSGGHLVTSITPNPGGPISFFNSCRIGTMNLSTFDTGPNGSNSSFCYINRQLHLTVFAEITRNAYPNYVDFVLYIYKLS